MPPKPTPTPATLAECRRLGATWLRFHCPHWALRDVAIWELYRDNGGKLERRLLGYICGDWQAFDGVLPMDVVRVDESEVTE